MGAGEIGEILAGLGHVSRHGMLVGHGVPSRASMKKRGQDRLPRGGPMGLASLSRRLPAHGPGDDRVPGLHLDAQHGFPNAGVDGMGGPDDPPTLADDDGVILVKAGIDRLLLTAVAL
jgi:hypothetical protein